MTESVVTYINQNSSRYILKKQRIILWLKKTNMYWKIARHLLYQSQCSLHFLEVTFYIEIQYVYISTKKTTTQPRITVWGKVLIFTIYDKKQTQSEYQTWFYKHLIEHKFQISK